MELVVEMEVEVEVDPDVAGGHDGAFFKPIEHCKEYICLPLKTRKNEKTRQRMLQYPGNYKYKWTCQYNC